METSTVKEVTFYNQSGVVVTQSRYVTNSKTYAMRNISSVYNFEIANSRIVPIILVGLGALFLFIGEAMVIGIILLALGILVLLIMKNKYAVRISTNSGESNSIVSTNHDYVQEIVNALNEAIIYRG